MGHIFFKCNKIESKLCDLSKKYSLDEDIRYLNQEVLSDDTKPIKHNMVVFVRENVSIRNEIMLLKDNDVAQWNGWPSPGIWKDGSPQWDEISLWNKMLLWKKMMQRYFNILYLIKCIRRQNEILTILDDEKYLENNKIKSNFDY